MNFESIKQLDFVSIAEGPALVKPANKPEGKAYITIGSYYIDMTKRIAMELGCPDFVEIGTLGELIGIKAVEKNNPKAVQVLKSQGKMFRVTGTDKILRISARIKTVADVDLYHNYIQVPYDRKEDGYYIFDLSRMLVCQKKNTRVQR